MRVAAVCALLIATLGLCSCESSRGQQTSTKPTIGFWFWQGSSAGEEWSGPPIDALFVHVGIIGRQSFLNVSGPNKQWNAYGQLPDRLPPAREYWLVYRYEMQGVPDPEAAPFVTNLRFGVRGSEIAGAQTAHAGCGQQQRIFDPDPDSPRPLAQEAP